MEKKKISVLTFVLVIIIVLAIGVAAGYFASIKLNEKDNVKKVAVKNEIPVKESVEKEVENKIENKIEEVAEVEEEEEEDEEEELASGERRLTQNELDLFEQYLETPVVANFVSVQFETAKDIDLQEFLRYLLLSRDEATLEEAQEITGEEDPFVPVHLYYKANIEEYFKKYTEIELSDLKYDFSKLYKGYYFYTRTSDAMSYDINVLSGIEKGNEYILKYDLENGTVPHFELTLKKVDGSFKFISNINIY